MSTDLPAGPGAAPRPASLQVAQDALVAAVDRLIEAERLYDMAEGEHAIEDAERDIESRDEPIIEAARCYVSTLRAAPVEAPQPRRQLPELTNPLIGQLRAMSSEQLLGWLAEQYEAEGLFDL